VDMNDRALRQITNSLGGPGNGYPREDGFDIVVASEVMAIFCLATSLEDLTRRLGNIIVARTRDKKPIYARDLKADGAMAVLLRDALSPNLVQTLEGTPAFIHGGPFANIAHGCNSVMATTTGLKLADYVVTEAGFGADLGAEKFFDIKCRFAELKPEAAVLVATVRALKLNGGANKKNLATEDLAALERGLPNLALHIANVAQFGMPVIVAVNRFTTDSDAELEMVADFARKQNVRVALNEVWEKGGAGGEELAREVFASLEHDTSSYRPLYDARRPIKEKIDTIVRKVYGGDGADYSVKADRAIEYLESIGLGETPVCMAKTQYSVTDDPTKLGRPTGFRIHVNEVYPLAGAGFVVAQAGDIMTMPGLPKEPAAEKMSITKDGTITGLF
jgi:formate--tetrahydrofolate ligase